VTKGDDTREAILQRAAHVASLDGLHGLTIGSLADDMSLSKSGLFAHFHSKEALQIQTLRFTAELFVDRVIRPALKAPRGEARLRALFERWLEWDRAGTLEGGCLFVAAASELDDRDGPVRDELVQQQRDWLELIGNVCRTGVTEGQFSPSLDPAQFAQDLHGVMLAYHHARRLLRDTHAERRARRAFDALVAAVKLNRRTRRP
jgi:AcrR family transcriptional regulator